MNRSSGISLESLMIYMPQSSVHGSVRDAMAKAIAGQVLG